MQLIRDPAQLAAFAGAALVPTMGALHPGHLALMRRAKELADYLILSIFVNPTQFAPDDDFDRYPRTLDADLEAAKDVGVDVVFMPEVDAMYPPDVDIPVPPLPLVATKPHLEDTHRRGHFAGVCQVVARLFDLVKPSVAVFGEKDYQQLLVIRAMVQQQADRWPRLRIESCPTVREPDGLALSSRNSNLSSDDRRIACEMYHRLCWAQHAELPGQASMTEAEHVMSELLRYVGFEVDYAVIRDAATLMPLERFDRPARALAAVRLGAVRLIDNVPVDPADRGLQSTDE